MVRTMKWILMIGLAVLMLAGCAPAATPEAAQFTDGLGRNVTLAAEPMRIVSLAPSNTEILFALGAGSKMVGRDEFSNYPEEAANLPTVGGSMGNYNFEQITSLKPDLVLAAEINTPEQVKALEELDIPVYYLSNPTNLDGMYENLRIVGELIHRSDEAEALVVSLQGRVKAVQDALKDAADKPVVFYELDGTDPAKPWTAGPGTFISQLIDMAGGESVGAALDADWAQISQEALLVANPDIILLGDAAYGMTAEIVAGRAGWDQIQAVKENKVFPFEDDWVSRPGPRLVDGLEELARLIHPELFD